MNWELKEGGFAWATWKPSDRSGETWGAVVIIRKLHKNAALILAVDGKSIMGLVELNRLSDPAEHGWHGIITDDIAKLQEFTRGAVNAHIVKRLEGMGFTQKNVNAKNTYSYLPCTVWLGWHIGLYIDNDKEHDYCYTTNLDDFWQRIADAIGKEG